MRAAVADSFAKLDPRVLAKNPVMFVVEVGSLLTTASSCATRRAPGEPRAAVVLDRDHAVAVVHRAVRELRRGGRRRPRQGAGRLAAQDAAGDDGAPARRRHGRAEVVSASQLRKGDRVVVEAGQLIPGDGEIVEGIASVDESAITGESAPVIRE